MRNTSILIYVLVITLILIGCKGKQHSPGNEIEDNDSLISVDHLAKVRKIFYNVPSPIEMANLTRKSGVVYSKDILNPVQNLDNYNTTSSLALNLGVYGADLSYCRIYDQIQESVNYLSAAKRITEALKIPQDEGSFALNRIEENLNNRDTLLKIIADVYSNADLYLKENDRGSTAVLIIVGGWIEALYIATHIIDVKNPDKELMKRIAEQKFSMESMVKLVQLYPENNDISEKIVPRLQKINEAFNQITITYKRGSIKTDSLNKTTSIGSESEVNVSIENITNIKELVTELRNEIVK